MTATGLIGVVDDEAEIRALLADILGREGYRVSVCANAEELWQVLESERPDLLLLDIRMPGEDGLSIARRVRGVSDVGIIMVSGLGETVDKVIGLEVGADDYVSKPFDRRELLARVRSVIRRRQTAATSMPSLLGKIETLEQKLDGVNSELKRLNEEALHIDSEATHLESLLHEHRVSACPLCGSTIVYHKAEKGSLGICNSCGWSHFVEE